MTTNYGDLSNRIKLLAHPERLRILDALRRDAECVCHLEALLGKPQPYVSQQLRILRDAGVIRDEKQGQNVFYRLTDAEMTHWLDAILGEIDGRLPEMERHKRVISCVCPKCNPQSVDTPIEAGSTIELAELA
jgi:DNA-binding transcriptional ArsR family regulator